MAFIVESIIGDRRIQLGNEQFYRKMAVDSNWNSLRIGVRWCFTQAARNGGFLGWPLIGVSESAVDYNSSNANHVGTQSACRTALFGADAWTTTSTIYPYQTSGYDLAASKVGVNQTLTSSGGASNTIASANPENVTFGCWVDVTKGSPNYTLQIIRSTTVLTTLSRSQFIQQLETPTSLYVGYTQESALTVAYGGNGLLSHVFIYWNKCTPAVEISDLAVLRLA